MKSDALFCDLKSRDNIKVLDVNEKIKKQFKNNYSYLQDKLFYEVMENCGGIVIDNWIRLYGCGELNVIHKNEMIINDYNLDIIIGEDVIGGIFALKDNVVFYFAPDSLEWECLDVYYANFMNWLINDTQNVNLFYKDFRWNNWKEESQLLQLTDGFSLYPFLFSKCDIEARDRKVISIDEIIMRNFEFRKNFK